MDDDFRALLVAGLHASVVDTIQPKVKEQLQVDLISQHGELCAFFQGTDPPPHTGG